MFRATIIIDVKNVQKKKLKKNVKNVKKRKKRNKNKNRLKTLDEKRSSPICNAWVQEFNLQATLHTALRGTVACKV